MELAAALELSDIRRNQQLGERLWTPLTREVVNDKQLEQRYRAAGIEHLFFVWAVTDPGERQRSRITRYVPRNGRQVRTCSLVFFRASLRAAGLNPENISADLVRTRRCRNSNPGT